MAVSAPSAVETELTKILLDSQSQNQAIRRSAEEKLFHAEEVNFAVYLAELAHELSSECRQSLVRQLAGILLKNAISGTDPLIDKIKRERWFYVPDNISTAIKERVLKTLESSCEEAQLTACQVIAKIGRLDMKLNLWPQLLPNLINYVNDKKAPVSQRKAAVTAFGYLCEDIGILSEELNADLLHSDQRNAILTTLFKAMQDEDINIVLTGCRAFYHAIPFAHENMAITADRDFIFGLVGRCLTYEDLRVLHAAWECTLQLITECYSYLEPYASEFGQHSLKTIQNFLSMNFESLEARRQAEMTAFAALEFWNTLCDIENILNNETAEAEGVQSKQYVKRAAPVLLPVLFKAITFEAREDIDSDEWTLSMAAGICVGLCAQVIGDDILLPALDFVNANFDNPDWKRRDAAVFVYGSIMDGPNGAQLSPLIQQSFPHLCRALNDPSVSVRDTAAWTIGRIASYHITCVLPMLDTTVQLLIEKIKDVPRVAAHICFAIHEIASNLRSLENNALDKYFESLAKALITTAQQPEAMECNLRVSAFEALSEVVAGIQSPNCEPTIIAVTEELQKMLKQTFSVQGSEEVWQLQEMLCGCLYNFYERLGKNPKIFSMSANTHFELLASVIASNISRTKNDPAAPTPAFQGVEGLGSTEERTSTSSDDEAMLAIGSLIRNFPSILAVHTPTLSQILIKGFRTPQNVRYCRACIGVVSEVAANSEMENVKNALLCIIPYLNDILKDTAAPISLKPALIGAISDIIVALENKFEPFYQNFADLLTHAANTQYSDGPESEEWSAYFQELRDSVFEAYSSILHGLCLHKRSSVLVDYELWFKHIRDTFQDSHASISNITKAVGVLSDLVACFRETFVTFLKNETDISALIAKTENHEDPLLRDRTMLFKDAIFKYYKNN